VTNIKRVRTAIIGCGAISDVYMENLATRFSICELVGCFDTHPDRAAEKAQKHGIRVMGLQEILDDASIELVVNLTPPLAHFSVIRDLLKAHKNVFTEKILAVKLEEAQELVRLAGENHVLLGSAPDTFLGSAIQTARQLIDAGLIGNVTSFSANVNRDYRTIAEYSTYIIGPGGGIGFDLGIYYVTALLSILGPVAECTGFLQTNEAERTHFFVRADNFGQHYRVECENVMVGSLKFRSGVLGTMHFNSDSIWPEHHFMAVYGTEGILYLANPDQFGGDVKLVRKGEEAAVSLQGNFGYSTNSRGVGAAELAWSLRKGRVPRANKDVALNAVETLHGIALSSQTGVTHRLKSTFERTPPLPQGYLDKTYMGFDPEAALAHD